MVPTPLAYVEFIEAPVFTRYLPDYLSDEDYRQLQIELASDPNKGDLMPGTGGFRKMRWADMRRGKGRRGGLRVIYYFFPSDHQIWLMMLYAKNEATDLTAKEKKLLKVAIENELRVRAAGRQKRSRGTQ